MSDDERRLLHLVHDEWLCCTYAEYAEQIAWRKEMNQRHDFEIPYAVPAWEDLEVWKQGNVKL